MLNQCQFIGHLGADPEIRRTADGKPVANFSLAVSERWKDKAGERQERTTWIPIVIFNEGLCGIAEKYLKKGSKVFVSGKFSVRKWQDKDGHDRYSTEIVLQGFNGNLTMLDSMGEKQGNSDFGKSTASNPADLDDEILF